MRLIFSTGNYLNTDISDERGYIHYTISTPYTSKKVTTITKYHWSGSSGDPETIAVIEWGFLKDTLLRFDGMVTPAKKLFTVKRWMGLVATSGWHFVGPDQNTYSWRIEKTHCWMKLAGSQSALVRYHQQNFEVAEQSKPAYLDLSNKVVPILDRVILTFIYVEWVRQW